MKRDVKNKMVFGVCAGIAKHLGLDPALVRIATALSFLFTGSITFWVYLLLAVIMPAEDA